MPEARVSAQAKINLRLKVLAREASGYHSIETIFARIDLADDVTIRVGPKGRSLDTQGSDLGPAEHNLAYRAAMAYEAATGWPESFAIEITKRIPVGGGLGGGSANAGAILRALDAIAPRPLGPRLVALAAELGADVPFMTLDAPCALAWSRGERLFPLPSLPARPTIIATPPYGIPTPESYGWIAESRIGFSPATFVIDQEVMFDWKQMAAIATNDFDAVVFARYPELGKTAASLRRHGALVSILAGSGSSVVGIFPDQKSADEAFGDLPIPGIATVTSTAVAPVVVGDAGRG